MAALLSCLRTAADAMKRGESRLSSHAEAVVRSVDIEQARAEGCKFSKYANVCPAGFVMIYADTVDGACSPAGCSSLLPASSCPAGATFAVSG